MKKEERRTREDPCLPAQGSLQDGDASFSQTASLGTVADTLSTDLAGNSTINATPMITRAATPTVLRVRSGCGTLGLT